MTTCLGKSCLFSLLCVFRERLSVCMCVSFPFGFKGGMWDLILLVPGPFHSIHFSFCFRFGLRRVVSFVL